MKLASLWHCFNILQMYYCARIAIHPLPLHPSERTLSHIYQHRWTHYQFCLHLNNASAVAYSIMRRLWGNYVVRALQMGIVSRDNCVDFVVTRALQTTNASPELPLPPGTSCASSPCFHCAYWCDVFETNRIMLSSRAKSRAVSLHDY